MRNKKLKIKQNRKKEIHGEKKLLERQKAERKKHRVRKNGRIKEKE